MKRIVSMVVAVLLLVTLSIPSFAYYDVPRSRSELYSEKDGDTYIGTFKTSLLTEPQKDFMREFLKSDRNVITWDTPDNVKFMILSSDVMETANFVAESDNNYEWCLSAKSESNRPSYKYLEFGGNGELVKDKSDKWYPSSSMMFGHIFSGSLFSNYKVNWLSASRDKYYEDLAPYSGTDYAIDFNGRLFWSDDDGLLEGKPEEPEEPDIPDTTDTIHVPASKPSFPNVNPDALPYDISVWDDFTEYIRTAIGSVGVVLIMTTFLFVAIGCVFAVIRHYLNQGKSDGGSDSGLI